MEAHHFGDRSGAGKTTTLRTIAGLEQPDAGRVLINGHDITFAAPRRAAPRRAAPRRASA